jgi:4-hydroxybenzoate polyprenyltransferase
MSNTTATPDAPATSWVGRLPPQAQPYLRLMRADRPIGTWLLLLPCWWGLALAWVSGAHETISIVTALWYAVLFAIGAFVMRGAGCVYNDIVDRDIDAQVARTATRPLPAGLVTLPQAWGLLITLCLIGLVVLLQFNRAAIITGLMSLGLVAAYPFMKRITWWPQAWLGLTFNWGILVGWVAMTGSIALPAILLYIAAIFWTLGYDTIYAHQDKEDDALIGVRSTARALDEATKPWLLRFYGATILFTALAGLAAGATSLFYLGLIAPALHLAFQVWQLDKNNPANCLILFKANRETGGLLLIAILLGQYSL